MEENKEIINDSEELNINDNIIQHEDINSDKKDNDTNNENSPEIDEDLEFLKNQIRHKKMIQEKRKQEEEEDYSYIKRFKINSYIETTLGIIALVVGILTKNYITDCLGLALICFGYLFRNVAKRGEYKRDKEKK